jgi:hypothetical protein
LIDRQQQRVEVTRNARGELAKAREALYAFGLFVYFTEIHFAHLPPFRGAHSKAPQRARGIGNFPE